MNTLRQDLQFAAHKLRRSRGFTAVAVLTLALGIGGTVAIFTVLNGVVLEPLPYPEADRLVRIESPVPGIDADGRWGVSPGGYWYYREHSRTLDEIGVYLAPTLSISGEHGPAVRAHAALVSASLLDVLGARPALGRLITPADDRPPAGATGQLPGPAERVVVLSHDFWTARYGADPGVIGTTIRVSGAPAPIVGVLEPGFELPGQDVDLWTQLGLNPDANFFGNWHSFQVIGRLAEGVTAARAERELRRLTERFPEAIPTAYSDDFMRNTGFTVDPVPLKADVVGDFAGTLWIVFAAVALVLLIACGLAVGLFPLLRFGAEVSIGALSEGGRGRTGRTRSSGRNVLVIGEIAMALVLLASAVLLLRTSDNLRSVESGIEPEGVLTVDVSLPSATYESYEQVATFYRELTNRVEGLPGVQSAGAIYGGLPFRGAGGGTIVFPEGWNARRQRYPLVFTPRVAPGYFEALGIPVEGQVPRWTESFNRTAGVVVSSAFAERAWPNEPAIGKRVGAYNNVQPSFRVVGVAGNVRGAGFDQPPVETVYFPMIPVTGARLWGPPRSMTLVVESGTARSEQLAGAIRRIVADIDPQVPIGDVQTMERVVASSMATISFTMLLLGIAAAIALLLGAVGLYGVIAYVVNRRRGEIGLRMALGARVGQVASTVVRQSLVLAIAGVVVGLVAAFAVTRVLQSLLFEVSATDPVTLAVVSLLLVGVALVASYIPARRAARVDPMAALRHE